MSKTAVSARRGIVKSTVGYFYVDHMQRAGLKNTMRAAYAINRVRFRREHAYRTRAYGELDTLLDENGPPKHPLIDMPDGWAIDASGTLPHLDRVLEDAEEIIAERAGTRTSETGTYRSFFQDVWTDPDNERYPSFLDFAMSSEVLGVVARYLESIPVLSTTTPAGIRFVESNAAFDDRPDEPHDSQLYHIDYYSRPNVYVIVLLHDTTFDHGPFSFLPRSVSERARHALGYWNRGVPFRLSDETVYSVADPGAVIEFSYPRGSVLFIESSGCFHFGSRRSVVPRFQLMYGYSTICRTDFSEFMTRPRTFPTRETDSRLRKLLLDKRYRG